MPNGDKNVTSNNEYANKEEKPIGMIPLEPVILGAKPKTKSNQSWSSEPDFIANDEAYQKAMNPLIADYKQSVTGAMGKAAGYIMEGALMAAPIPGLNIVTKALGGAVKFAASKTPFRNLINTPKPSFNILGASGTKLNNEFFPGLLPASKISQMSYYNIAQREGVTNYMNILSRGADTAKKARLSEITALSSGEGKKRLISSELQYIEDAWKAQRGNITGKGLSIDKPIKFSAKNNWTFGTYPSTIKPGDFAKYAKLNAERRIKELKFPSANEQLAAIKQKTGGKLGFGSFVEAQNILYRKAGGAVGNVPGSFKNNAFAQTVGDLITKSQYSPISLRFKVDAPRWALGTGNLYNLPTAKHEIGHVLQKGIVSKLDDSFRTLKSTSNKKHKEFFQHDYFATGSKGAEPTPFGREFRSLLQQENIIKSRFQTITPNILKK